MHRLLRLLVGVTAVCVLVASGATPASATTGTITGGTLVINTTPVWSFDPVSGTGPCPGVAPMTVDVVTSSATAGTMTMGFSGVIYSPGTTRYFLVASGSGPVSISGGLMAIGPITMTGANVYPETSPGNCVPNLTAPRCGAMTITLGTTLDVWSGTFSPPGLTGTVTIQDEAAGIVAAGCTPPFGALNGKQLTFGGVAITF